MPTTKQPLYIVETRIESETVDGTLFIGSTLESAETFIKNNLDYYGDDAKPKVLDWYWCIFKEYLDLDWYNDNCSFEDIRDMWFYLKDGTPVEDQPLNNNGDWLSMMGYGNYTDNTY